MSRSMAPKTLPPKGEDMVGRYMDEHQPHDDMTGSHIAAGKSAGGARVNRLPKTDKLPNNPFK